jgi:thiamine monophosphate synthase
MSDFATVMEIYLSTGSAMNAANAAQAIATQVGLGPVRPTHDPETPGGGHAGRPPAIDRDPGRRYR